MVNLEGVKEVKQLLSQLGVNSKHISQAYNDKLKEGRRFKIKLVVYGGAITGDVAMNTSLAKKVGDKLTELGMEDIYISERVIEFKNRKG